jgi:hypothetical protein
MASASRPLSPGRAARVEARLRTRSEQLKPADQVTPGATPLGVCRTCDRITYAGQRFVMRGIYVFHADCVSGADAEGTA